MKKSMSYKSTFSFESIIILSVALFALFSSQFVYAQQATEAKKLMKPISSAQAVKIITPDEYLLAADYYRGDDKGAGVLILHDCAHTSKSYIDLGEKLSKNGIHSLALDFRGYGASSSEIFSHESLKKNAKNIIAYQNDVAALTSYWELDVLTAFNFLRTKVERQRGIAVVSVGCASLYAVALAEKMRINSMVLITPIMNYSGKERYKNLIDIPSYFINSSHHIETIQTSKELFEWNGSKSSKIQIFKSDAYDYGLLRRNKYLIDDISSWLKKNLR